MFESEKFIYAVEKLPALYDVKSSDYSNRQLKAQGWNEVGEAMHDNWNQMRAAEKDQAGPKVKLINGSAATMTANAPGRRSYDRHPEIAGRHQRDMTFAITYDMHFFRRYLDGI